MTEVERPIRVWPQAPVRRALAVVTACALAVTTVAPAWAQDMPRGLPLIRDAELEQLLRDYTQPILKAAGLAQQNIRVIIIHDRSFNAFVMDGRRIFVNAGALMESTVPNQIIGVLAHETGHIAGGHLSRLREQLAQAQSQMIIAMLLGIGAMVAASKSGRDVGNPSAAMLGPQSMIQRSLLSYQRAQEEQADRAGVKFLNETRQSPKGMHDTFKRMADQILFVATGADPYTQSHPMPAERVSALAIYAKTSPYWDTKDSAELQLRHDMARAKLVGFLERRDTVARKYPTTDNSLPARYARAIATYRHSDLRVAVTQIDALINDMPNNPYLYELKGQALLEGGKAAEAIEPLRRAVKMAPNPALIQVMLAQAINSLNNAKLADEAVTLLRTALAREPEIPEAYSQLAMAFGRKGDLAQADLASAQAAFTRSDYKTARELASRAKTRFAVGSPGWVKADDIASFKPPAGMR
ncbi:MAG: M48 family metalloprotease [Xanthobacteraceae bacterium]|jgi:predicted Zn-dependent protease